MKTSLISLMKRIPAPKTWFSLLIWLIAPGCTTDADQNHQQIRRSSPPNIVCILVDDLGFGDLAVQGAPDMLTPNLDAFAESGIVFHRFYANCPVCSPSRAALLTGQFPDRVGVPGVIRTDPDNNWGYLKENTLTLPQRLKEAGYHTGLIGKWHLGLTSPNTPNERGFDHFHGFLGDMMDDYYTHLRGGINFMRFNDSIIDPDGHATELFTDWAIDYVHEQGITDNPFFLYLAYNAPHFPIQPPQAHLEKVQVREPEMDLKRAKNVAFIEHLDAEIGRFFQELKQSGLTENTLVIFTSDNGGALPYAQRNLPWRGGKQQMYEGGIRVPAFAVWPGHIQPGSQTDNMGLLMDLFPTFNEIAGLDSIHGIDGISLLSTLEGSTQTTDDRYLFWVRREGNRYGGQAYYAVQYKGYKLLQNSAYEPLAFFNLNEDPYEETSLPNEGEIYQDLRRALMAHIQRAGGVPWQVE